MANESAKKEETIYYEALNITSAEERENYLKKACGADKELLTRVHNLLKAHEEAKGFLENAPLCSGITLDDDPIQEVVGTVIGRYKLLEKIGEGGMAVVYMAEQREPIHRKVALKIIKRGMDTKQVIARFEVERQALAMMDHPNIAKVLDAGATETGRPYFVMELVHGVSITEYCDKNNLDNTARLELFIQVCRAVQHAHQKGIIHRDIKPSNVMVTLHDGKPVPMVIDFGIAKATSQRLTEKTLFTRFACMIGTPEYMSPEQAEMSGLDIDTRTDIYSLGVLLYELLTGAPPFNAEELRSKGYMEMQRIIREEEPPKPSTRLSTMGNELTIVANHRHCSPDLLQRLVRGDLDWIVMKSLDKDRTHRYETVSELALDIQRHLQHEPVLASPPSVAYRIKKFVRRNKTMVTGIVIILVVLLAGIVVSTIFAIGQSRARATADEARLAEAQQKRIAEERRDQALKAQHETQRANEKLIWENYATSISLAQKYVDEGNIQKAKELLAACPEQHRHWEWGYLQYLCSQDLKTIQTDLHSFVHSIAFSPDGRLVATGSISEIKIWDRNMERVLMTLPGKFVAFSPDSRYLAVWYRWWPEENNKKEVCIWDVETGQKVKTFREDSTVETAAFNPNGQLLATGNSNGTIKIWNLATGQPLYTLKENDAELSWMAFSPDGSILATANVNNRIILWDVKTGETIKEHNSEVTVGGLAFTPDGQYLIFSGIPELMFWNIHNNLVETVDYKLEGWSPSLSISWDGKYLAIGSSNGITILYDLEKREEIYVFQGTSRAWMRPIAFSPSGKYLITSGEIDGTVKYWDLKSLDSHLRFKGAEGRRYNFAFSPNGQWIAAPIDSESSTISIGIWDLTTGHLHRTLTGHNGPVSSVAFSPDSSLLATGSEDTLVKLWSVETGHEIQTLEGHKGEVQSVSFHPKERILATGSSDQTVMLWDLVTGQELRTLSVHTVGVFYRAVVAFSPDGLLLVTGSSDGKIKIWDIKSGEIVKELENHTGGIGFLSFSSDGKLLASAGEDNTARIWALTTGQQLAVLKHSHIVIVVVLSPDGKRLITQDMGFPIKIWDVATQRQIMTLRTGTVTGIKGRVTGVSPDGKMVSVFGYNGTILLPAFPWKENEYPGNSDMPLEERIELYKRDYWKQQEKVWDNSVEVDSE